MDDLTRAPGAAPAGSTVSSSSGTSWGRFAPGTLLGGRFRTSLRSAAAAWARSTALGRPILD
jgi:hypothetical protein